MTDDSVQKIRENLVSYLMEDTTNLIETEAVSSLFCLTRDWENRELFVSKIHDLYPIVEHSDSQPSSQLNSARDWIRKQLEHDDIDTSTLEKLWPSMSDYSEDQWVPAEASTCIPEPSPPTSEQIPVVLGKLSRMS